MKDSHQSQSEDDPFYFHARDSKEKGIRATREFCNFRSEEEQCYFRARRAIAKDIGP